MLNIRDERGSSGVSIPMFVIILIGLMIMFIPSQLNFFQRTNMEGEMQKALNNAVMNAVASEANEEEFRDRVLGSQESLLDLGVVKETFVRELQDQLGFVELSKMGYDEVIVVTGIREAGGVSYMQNLHKDNLKITPTKTLFVFVEDIVTGSANDSYHFSGGSATYFYLGANIVISPSPFYYNSKKAQKDLVDGEITALQYEKNVFTNLGYDIEHDNLGVIQLSSASRVYFRER